MASSSGNSSGSTSSQIKNSGSEGDPQLLMDQRKRKRMQSNRESARRSRMRKQKHLDDLMAQVAQIKEENSQILSTMNITTQQFLNVEAENSVLGAQLTELTQRLQSLNEILSYMNTSNGMLDTLELQPNSEIFMNNPWNLIYPNQPIMASADMFPY
ncbi:bZIP transcription factor 11-like [Coffea eugenioides]|uniref:BZIP transcription factor 44-like n=1 Tax=Coffea arabica TaxID=13443 RepID=A0ABM4W098_COFAR|nr:bZIP transcription factor 11-like [Coffea eugenioides]